MTINAFMLEHIIALSSEYEVTLAGNFSAKDLHPSIRERVSLHYIKIQRKISLLDDLAAVASLYIFLCKASFNTVHSVTPKAGLIAMLASFGSRIPVRLHTFTGQVWVTRSGIARIILKSIDRLIAALATHVLIDSFSQQHFLTEEGVVSGGKSSVLGNGSISGVDLARFRPDPAARVKLRQELEIGNEQVVILYLGRLNKDKGLLDLAEAFSGISEKNKNMILLMVGPDEEQIKDRIESTYQKQMTNMRFVPHTAIPEQFMACADIFCLPSYREGFGSVIIEAAAAGLPAIGSNIYGIKDAIENNVSGLLFECRNISDLSSKIECLVKDEKLRKELGINARNRAMSLFPKELVTMALVNYYRSICPVS